MNSIAVKNLQRKIPLNASQIKKIALQTLCHEDVQEAEISLTFVSAQRITALNRKYLNRFRATDVLAFDLREKNRLIGEVIISTDAARKNAKIFQTSVKYELALYVVHGILHLLGYDDHAPQETRTMRDREKAILCHLGILP